MNKHVGFFFHWIGIHPFDTEEELQQFFKRHKKNRDFAIVFTQDGSNGQLNYTIQTRNNNFRTEQIFLNNIYEIANRGKQSINYWEYKALSQVGLLFRLDIGGGLFWAILISFRLS